MAKQTSPSKIGGRQGNTIKSLLLPSKLREILINVIIRYKTKLAFLLTIIIVFSMVLSSTAIYYLFATSIDRHTERSFDHTVEKLRHSSQKEPQVKTNYYSLQSEISALLNTFLTQEIISEGKILLVLLDGKLHMSNPTNLPDFLKPPSTRIETWAKITEPEWGETQTKFGIIYYLAKPFRTRERQKGVFVVVDLPSKENQMLRKAATNIEIVQGIMIIIASTSLLAWFAIGEIINRLRLVTETLKFFDESDLNQTILVAEENGISELTIALNEMLERFRSAFTNQQNFINDMSHELRTPITIIQSYLEELSLDSEEQNQATAIIADEFNRIIRFADEMLLLAKAEQPDFLNLEIVEIGSLTETVYLKASTLATRNWQLEAKGSGRMIADPQRITQAILNLSQNAVYHTSEDSTIALGSVINNGKIFFWVRDTGEGIDPANFEDIFKRFTRVSNNLSLKRAGLGLAIVQAIVQAHSGWVTVESQPGHGSNFTIVIPLESF